MPVSDLLDRIPARELTEWQAYEQLAGPIGPKRDDILTAQVVYTLASAFQSEKGRRPKLEDFIPDWTVKEKPRG
jgi:hypothetical protein